ncbi:hypothetical protein BJV74DRAFT_864556, partial [Russula compacta]
MPHLASAAKTASLLFLTWYILILTGHLRSPLPRLRILAPNTLRPTRNQLFFAPSRDDTRVRPRQTDAIYPLPPCKRVRRAGDRPLRVTPPFR